MPRRLLDRDRAELDRAELDRAELDRAELDRAELDRRRDRTTMAPAGHQPPPIEPLKDGAAARQLIEQARAWAY